MKAKVTPTKLVCTMDSTGNAKQPLSRGKKRTAEEEATRKLGKVRMAKRRQIAFRPRLIPSANDSGHKSVLIGPLDIITDPNIPKIQIPRETEEKPETKEEETTGEEDQETQRSLATGSQNQPFRKDLTIIVKEAMETEPPATVECKRCQNLEKELDEQKTRNLKTEQRVEELSKSLAEKSSTSKTEDEKSCDIDQVENSDMDNGSPIISAILNGKSVKEIQNLMKMNQDWKQKDGKGNSVLHLAARTGNTELVKLFVSLGAEVNARNSTGSTPLMEAAKSTENFSEIVDLLVAKGADLMATNKSGENALCIALTLRKTAKEIQKLSFSKDNRYKVAFEDTADHDGNTLLHKAVEAGNLDLLIYFLSLKPNVNLKNGKGMTPVMSAVLSKQNFSSVVDLLLISGANINAVDTIVFAIETKTSVNVIKKLVDVGAHWNKDTILFSSREHGYVDAIKYFIRIGANVNAKKKVGTEEWTITMEAACLNMKEVVDILIENGAEPLRGERLSSSAVIQMVRSFKVDAVSFPDLYEYGVTWDDSIFHLTVTLGKLGLLRFFVSKGANVNAKFLNGDTPILLAAAATKKNILEIMDFLVSNGANVNEVDKNGLGILHRAAECSSRTSETTLAVLKKLTGLGATWGTGVVGNGQMKESILHAAVCGGHSSVVQYIISKGVDVDCKDSNGNTPFLLAVKDTVKDMPEILQALVKGGADPNARDNSGNTALLLGVGKSEWGARRLTVDQVKLLIEVGCDWRLPNKEGVNAIGKLDDGRYELLKYLKNLG